MRAQTLTLSLPFALLLAASGAQAQPQPTDDPRIEEARNHYRAGVAAFGRRRFSDAVIEFERSFRARPHPATLYNAAEARLRAGDQAGAVEQLRQLLAMTDPAPDAELTGRARTLAEQAGETNLQPATRETTPGCPQCPTCPPALECPVLPPPPQQQLSHGPLPYILAGGALVLVGLGVGFYAVALDNSNTYEDPGASRDLQNALRDQGETFRWVGLSSMVLGVGAAAASFWLFAHPARRSVPTASRVNFAFGPGSLGISGTF